jgi:hypothetical protein
VADTDVTSRLDKSAGLGDAGYDPVVKVDELEKILGLSQHEHEDHDCEAKRGVSLSISGLACWQSLLRNCPRKDGEKCMARSSAVYAIHSEASHS